MHPLGHAKGLQMIDPSRDATASPQCNSSRRAPPLYATMSSCTVETEASEEDASFSESKEADHHSERAGRAAARASWMLCTWKESSWFRGSAAGAREPKKPTKRLLLAVRVEQHAEKQEEGREDDLVDLDAPHAMLFGHACLVWLAPNRAQGHRKHSPEERKAPLYVESLLQRASHGGRQLDGRRVRESSRASERSNRPQAVPHARQQRPCGLYGAHSKPGLPDAPTPEARARDCSSMSQHPSRSITAAV